MLRYVFDSNNDSSLQSVTGDLDQDLCKQMAIIALIALPGYYFAVALTDYFGRRAVQLQVVHGDLWPLDVISTEHVSACTAYMQARPYVCDMGNYLHIHTTCTCIHATRNPWAPF